MNERIAQAMNDRVPFAHLENIVQDAETRGDAVDDLTAYACEVLATWDNSMTDDDLFLAIERWAEALAQRLY